MNKFIELALFRLERAKEDLKDAELLYENNRYKTANNINISFNKSSIMYGK